MQSLWDIVSQFQYQSNIRIVSYSNRDEVISFKALKRMQTGDDGRTLQRGIKDLVALTTLPALWMGKQPDEIAESLSEVMLLTLRLELVYITLKQSPHDDTFELIRTDDQVIAGSEARDYTKVFEPYLKSGESKPIQSVPDPIHGEILEMVVIPIGYDGQFGYAVAGTQPTVSLSEMDCLLLSVAANQAVTALQQSQLLEDVRAANQHKMQFLAMISHELRTPLTSIKGFASTLMAQDVSWDEDNQREFIEIINHEADKLTNLVEELLDLSRLQVGKLNIMPLSRSMGSLVQECHNELTILAKSHELVISIDEDLPPVLADSKRIAQVLTNLVSNAAKYSPAGTTITFSAHQLDEQIQIDVSDQGVGIAPQDRRMVFEAFRQLHPGNQATISGAGLGLAICKGLVEAHGGNIWIQDRPPPGTTISFTLPVGELDMVK